MLKELHQLTHQVLYRKTTKWRKTTNYTPYPVLELHQQYLNEMLQWLDYLENHQRTWQQISCNLFSICGIKQELEATAWQVPATDNQDTMACFVNDLLFYLMVNSLIMNGCSFFRTFCEEHEHPSKIFLKLNIKITHKQLNKIINTFDSEAPWIEQVLRQPTPAYEQHLYDIEKKIEKMISIADIYTLLKQWLCTLYNYPDNQMDESNTIEQITIVSHHIDTYMQHSSWSSLRQIILTCLCSSTVIYFTTKDYSKLYEALNTDELPEKEEIQFWKYGLEHLSEQLPYTLVPEKTNLNIFKGIIKYLKHRQKHKNAVPCSKECHKRAIWNFSPKDFFRLFHLAIAQGQLQFEGSSEITSIVEFLNSKFLIRTKNKKGFLDKETVLTYFNKFSNGDME